MANANKKSSSDHNHSDDAHGKKKHAVTSLRDLEQQLVQRLGPLQQSVSKHHARAREHYAKVVNIKAKIASAHTAAAKQKLLVKELEKEKNAAKNCLAREKVSKRNIANTESLLEKVIDVKETLESAALQAEINQTLSLAQEVLAGLSRDTSKLSGEIQDAHEEMEHTQEILDAFKATNSFEEDEEELMDELNELLGEGASSHTGGERATDVTTLPAPPVLPPVREEKDKQHNKVTAV